MPLKKSLAVVGGAIIVALGIMWAVGSELVRPQNHPVPLPAGFQAQAVSIPGKGHDIAGWWVDAGPGTPVVLLIHGIRADRSSMVGRSQLLKRHGFSTLLIDLQAEGETPGEAITLGYLESADVVAARNWIRDRAPGRRVGVIGESLGGASVLLAPQPVEFDAVVLEAVFPRLRVAVENRVRMWVGPLAPAVTPLLLVQLHPRLHVTEEDLEPIRSIARLGAPLLLVAGSQDKHTTLAESQELFAAAADPKSMWVVEGAKHQDLLHYDPPGYEDHVIGFLDRNLISTPTPVQ